MGEEDRAMVNCRLIHKIILTAAHPLDFLLIVYVFNPCGCAWITLVRNFPSTEGRTNIKKPHYLTDYLPLDS